MQTLSLCELKEVSGGVGLKGAAIGFVGGAVGAIAQGKSLSGIAGDAALGAGAGFSGNMVGATSGFVRAGWAVRAVLLPGGTAATE